MYICYTYNVNKLNGRERTSMKKITIAIAIVGAIILILGLASLTGGQIYAHSFIIAGLSILLIDVFVPAIYELIFKTRKEF